MRLLAEEARRRIDRHPHGHLAPGGDPILALHLRLPISGDQDLLAAATRDCDADLDRAVDDLLAAAETFRPGRVFCLRCGGSDCAHAAPPSSRHVFQGFGPTGAPQFADFAQLLLDRREPRLDQLYAEPPAIVAAALRGRELERELLPSFRDARREFRVLGEVVAGWFRSPAVAEGREALAVSLLIVAARAGGRERLGLNIVAAGPAGEPIEWLHDRMGGIPWAAAARWGQATLREIERGRLAGPAFESRIEGTLVGVARRIEREERARGRRTKHAEERHAQGERPTRMAALDLSRAPNEAVLHDERRNTYVVLGERGRTHVFSLAGKLITSVRYPAQTIAQRRESGVWRASSAEEIAALRARVAGDAEGR